MAITSPWIGSSAKAETGKANMSEAGTALKMTTPFWMSEMKGKSIITNEADVEFTSTGIGGDWFGAPGGWSSKPLMDQKFVPYHDGFSHYVTKEWQSPRGTLIKPSGDTFSITTANFFSITSHGTFNMINAYSNQIVLAFTGTRIDVSKYSVLRVAVLNNNTSIDFIITDSAEYQGQPVGADGYNRPFTNTDYASPEKSATYAYNANPTYVMNAVDNRTATTNERNILALGRLIDQKINIRLKITAILK